MSPPRSVKREKPEKVVTLTSGGANFKIELWPKGINILRQRPAGRYVSIGRLTFRPHQHPRHTDDPGLLELNGSFTLEPLPDAAKTRETEIELVSAAEGLVSEKHPEIREVVGKVVDTRNLKEPLDVGRIFTELITLKEAGGRFALARKKHAQTAAAKIRARQAAKSRGPVVPPKKTAKKTVTRKMPPIGPRRRR